jgi:hypothetical protein
MEILLILKHPTKKITNTLNRGDYFQFGSVFIKKITKSNFFFKKTKTRSNLPVSVWFFRAKTGSNWFGSIFPVFSVFSGFGSVFFGLTRFFSVLFSRFFTYKTETEPAGFFKILIGLIGFFSQFNFFGFFLVFSVF